MTVLQHYSHLIRHLANDYRLLSMLFNAHIISLSRGRDGRETSRTINDYSHYVSNFACFYLFTARADTTNTVSKHVGPKANQLLCLISVIKTFKKVSRPRPRLRAKISRPSPRLLAKVSRSRPRPYRKISRATMKDIKTKCQL